MSGSDIGVSCFQDNLDYIQGMGFDAIWISPVVKNTPDGYHGYWAKDLYSVNEQFGSAEDLKALVQACHARDIWVMVDVVANHFGPQANGNDDFSQFTPFNKPEHYHPYCVISQQDWDSMNQVPPPTRALCQAKILTPRMLAPVRHRALPPRRPPRPRPGQLRHLATRPPCEGRG